MYSSNIIYIKILNFIITKKFFWDWSCLQGQPDLAEREISYSTTHKKFNKYI